MTIFSCLCLYGFSLVVHVENWILVFGLLAWQFFRNYRQSRFHPLTDRAKPFVSIFGSSTFFFHYYFAQQLTVSSRNRSLNFKFSIFLWCKLVSNFSIHSTFLFFLVFCPPLKIDCYWRIEFFCCVFSILIFAFYCLKRSCVNNAGFNEVQNWTSSTSNYQQTSPVQGLTLLKPVLFYTPPLYSLFSCVLFD